MQFDEIIGNQMQTIKQLQQKEIDQKIALTIQEKNRILKEKTEILENKTATLNQLNERLKKKTEILKEKTEILKEKTEILNQQKRRIAIKKQLTQWYEEQAKIGTTPEMIEKLRKITETVGFWELPGISVETYQDIRETLGQK